MATSASAEGAADRPPPPGPGRRDRPAGQAGGPTLLELFGVGPETSGQRLASAGDNPEHMRSEGVFTHLAGVAPIPASSGRTHRHRLNRDGTRLSKKDIMRCPMRLVAREVYRALTSTPATHITQNDLAPAA
ncbi:transposase [Streptomyces sp. NPDC088812]|uniref:transposase n=1 Tax=Streptomyces sp. NPDC088812 TaxID=3365905 RepID=UPI003806F487